MLLIHELENYFLSGINFSFHNNFCALERDNVAYTSVSGLIRKIAMACNIISILFRLNYSLKYIISSRSNPIGDAKVSVLRVR